MALSPAKQKIKRKRAGQTLQSPNDPDASCGPKGKGYSAHITETYKNKVKGEIINDFDSRTPPSLRMLMRWLILRFERRCSQRAANVDGCT